MLAPSEALSKARVYLGEVVPEFAALQPKVDEMVLAPDSSKWIITFFAQAGGNRKAETVADLLSNPRIEKVISIAADDGSLVAVRNPSF
jgi:phage pi2 protein 07